MGRHALMYRNQRQHGLARKIAPGRLLVARMAKHQRLLHELMPTAGTSERIHVLPDRRYDWMRQRALPLAGSRFRPLLVGEAEEERALSPVPSPVPDRLLVGQDEEDLGQEAAFGLAAGNAVDRTGVGPSPLPDRPEKVSSQQEARVESVNQFSEVGDQEVASTDRRPETQMSEPLEVQVTEGDESSDSVPEVPLIRREDAEQPSGINEPVEAKHRQEQKIVDERARPMESTKTRRSRGRIQEQPAEPVHTPPILAALPSPPSRVARRNEQEAAGKEEASVADELFASRDTDRSPQAWMARLMGTKSAPGDDVAAAAATVESEPVGVQTGSVAGEQPERSQQPADSGQLIPPGRQGGFAPASEDQVRVMPQTDQGQRFKTGSSLPTAEANVVRGRSETRSAPTPLSERARRFLQPLVGIDPASVPVYRDAQAEQLADDYRADAITVGDNVAIAAGHPDDTPETLGLLAHEFTHVARQREPRFVPPIARMSSRPFQVGRSPLIDEMAVGTLSIQADEEELAQQVERRVTRAAEGQADTVALDQDAGAGITRAVPAPRTASDSWGGLPAPWEPLPDWLLSSVTTEDSGHTVVAPQQPQVAHVGGEAGSGLSEPYGGSGTWNGSGPSDTGVQRAGMERSLGEEEQMTASAEHPVPGTTKAPEPDLDMLARQVYSLLKRRLEVERRRES